jgi:hypothetical protein
MVVYLSVLYFSISVPDPNPDQPDPHVFGPPGSGFGSIRQRCGSGPDSDPSIIKQNSKKNLDSNFFVTSFGLFIVEK